MDAGLGSSAAIDAGYNFTSNMNNGVPFTITLDNNAQGSLPLQGAASKKVGGLVYNPSPDDQSFPQRVNIADNAAIHIQGSSLAGANLSVSGFYF